MGCFDSRSTNAIGYDLRKKTGLKCPAIAFGNVLSRHRTDIDQQLLFFVNIGVIELRAVGVYRGPNAVPDKFSDDSLQRTVIANHAIFQIRRGQSSSVIPAFKISSISLGSLAAAIPWPMRFGLISRTT